MTPTTPETAAAVPGPTLALQHADGSGQRTLPQRLPFYYGWINVVLASLAMTATLPSRTHGLGLIAKPLQDDLGLTETLFTSINFVSCMLGAVFCVPVGYWIDRHGVRILVTTVSVLFGLSVLGMATVTGPVSLLITLTLIRGFGQCALSIVSIAIVGKWFNRRMGFAMGVYTILMSIGFMVTIVGTGELTKLFGWRIVWNGCGMFLLCGLAPLGWLLVRNTPEECGVANDAMVPDAKNIVPRTADFTWQQALRTPAFWVFACGTAMFNFVWSANTLLNETILAERGFAADFAMISLALLVPGGLIANFVCGAKVRRHNLGSILGLGLLMLSICLALFPQITNKPQLILYSIVLGVVGGIVTVAHFAAWRALYGRSHLGRIQGPAQILSVIFSATGPSFAAWCHQLTGSYRMGFYSMSAVVGALAVASLLVPIPPELPGPADDGSQS